MTTDDHSIGDAIDADVIAETPDTLLVRFPDGCVESVSKNSVIGTFCDVEDLDTGIPVAGQGRALVDEASIDLGGTGIEVAVEIDTDASTGTITVGDDLDSIDLTGRRLARVLTTVLDEYNPYDISTFQGDIDLSNETATQLYELYEEIIENRVRQDVIERVAEDTFMDIFVEITDEGWIVEDTYLVTYEAENYLVDDVTTYQPSGGSVTEVDGTKQAVGMSFDIDGRAIIELFEEDEPVVLSEVEQEFLAMVEVLMQPSSFLDVNTFEQEVYRAIERAKADIGEDVTDIALTVSVSHYIDPQTGLLHNHELNKHVLQSSFAVQNWVIDDLHYNSFDHAGVNELAWREEELRNADRDVFWDTHNDDDSRWYQISDTADSAPCPPEVYQRLRAMYGSE